ncbi:hypothetical protein UP15_08670 [Bacillus pumilus]|uniref:Uncharacterized protein n=1 Tax=Bacillus altitudinis TaxID=293387 RepID=A0A653RBV0_BACAB|nr:hypothetical protein UP15_08670 [Bacillus pumilus]PJI13321.1 hypothetical protein CTV96_07740 [Bacillus altitudinis]PKQ86285.1 hypothetical protein CTV98_005775 [Bacillus altitudinis]PYH25591.1 hypothetical protein US8_03871 [Bacillus altitudinis]VXB50896.1 conserved hypothetical protein [Bacillus altitudinis]
MNQENLPVFYVALGIFGFFKTVHVQVKTKSYDLILVLVKNTYKIGNFHLFSNKKAVNKRNISFCLQPVSVYPALNS